MLDVSRIFGSRFRIYGSIYDSRDSLKLVGGTSLTYPSYGPSSMRLPPSPDKAFLINHYGGAGTHLFIGRNLYASQNSQPVYPPSAVTSWEDTVWSRIPLYIVWYHEYHKDAYGDFVPLLSKLGDGRAGPATYQGSNYTLTYRMYVSLYQQIKITNNSSTDVVAYYRSFWSHTFPDSTNGDFGSIVMTSWASISVPSGESVYVSGFRPLEVKFDSTSTEENILGITDQNGDKVLMLF